MISTGNCIRHKLVNDPVQVDMCVYAKTKSVCVSSKTDQSLRFLHKEMFDPWLPMEDSGQTA